MLDFEDLVEVFFKNDLYDEKGLKSVNHVVRQYICEQYDKSPEQIKSTLFQAYLKYQESILSCLSNADVGSIDIKRLEENAYQEICKLVEHARKDDIAIDYFTVSVPGFYKKLKARI